MKKTIVIVMLLVSLSAFAQQADSVISGGNDVFYNLNDGQQNSVNKDAWDIGFTTAGFDASIIVNETKGLKLYVYSQDTSLWNTVDTAGFNFTANELYNSSESWENGAFNNLNVTFPDYGWGQYNSSNHYLNGTRIFLLEMPNGSIYQIHIVELTVGGLFTVKTSELGGVNTSYTQIAKGDHDTKNYVYFNVANRTVVDLEPVSDTWHLLFTKYHTEVQPGFFYPVSGVKINKGLKVAKRMGVDVLINDTIGLAWSTNITEIGYDWKSFNNSTFQYEITQDLSYFIKNDDGDVWKIWFTNYTGGSYYFNIEKIAHNASITKPETLNAKVYPVPANEFLQIENRETERSVASLFTLSGQLLKAVELDPMSISTLNVAELNSGFYILRISGNNKQLVQRVIIE